MPAGRPNVILTSQSSCKLITLTSHVFTVRTSTNDSFILFIYAVWVESAL